MSYIYMQEVYFYDDDDVLCDEFTCDTLLLDKFVWYHHKASPVVGKCNSIAGVYIAHRKPSREFC